MQKVDEIEEAYTGEEPKAGSLCFMPKIELCVNITKMQGTIWHFSVHNGCWEGQYDCFRKKMRVRDEEADYLSSQNYYPSADGSISRAYIDPWSDAGSMLVIDEEVLSEECLSKWYIQRKTYNVNSRGNLEVVFYDETF